MSDLPRLLCPQCGGSLRDASGSTCPECGFFIGMARVHHRGALHYWRYLRARRWVEIVFAVLWLGGAVLACWLLSFSPGKGFVALTAVAGLGVVGLAQYLSLRRKKK